MKDKKALSIVVSYVLLIVIAISLSVIVYAWLKVQIPKERLECPDGLSIIIAETKCIENSDEVEISFKNKGRFDIDGVYARYSRDETKVASLALKPTGEINPITSDQRELGFLYFGKINLVPLSPESDVYAQQFQYVSSLKKIQIQPFINDPKERELIICEDKAITQLLNCL